MKKEVIKFLYLERIGLLFRHIIYFLLNCSMGGQTETASCVSLHLCSLCPKHPNSLGTLQLANEIMKTFYQEGNISVWQAHLCDTPSAEVLQKKICGHMSYTGFLMSCCYYLKDSLKWGPSQWQDKIALFSVRRDNRNHAVQPSHIMDGESETQLKNLLQGYAASW